MIQKTTLQKSTLFVLLSTVFSLLSTLTAQEVPFTPRLDDSGNSYVTIKGDYISLSNTVMNRRNSRRNDPSNVNDPYNGGSSNNSFHVEYVDIDGDPSTFSSTSSTLSLPDCSRIYYAGLYWAGNYDEDVIDSRYTNTSRPDPLPNDANRYDYTAIKFKLPGGNYIDLQADNANDPVGEEDEIIIDGHTAATPVRNSPYVCYKNVTGLLQAMTDPQGEYTVANVRGTRGQTNHGAAGWTLVIIYENPTLPGRYISTFDGYEGVTTNSGDAVADIPVVGFNTVPVGNVKARIGASVLEGEASLSGDSFQILSDINRANGQAYTALFNDVNDVDNFFNSNITEDNAIVTTRNINGTNSMGYDADVFEINNPAESVIPNGETGATLRLTTSSDWFGAFLVTFGVDIIEPNIVLEKEVWDEPEDNNLTGLGVNLGARLKYILSFENTGNDDATNYTIRDVLPLNTFPPNGTSTSDFAPGDITVPAGVTYTYDIPTRTLLFTIPDYLVIEDSPRAQIKINVQVAQNCFDFIDACSDQIQNLAYSTYQGVDNPNVITDDPSVTDFNACGFITPGATNFLLDDLANCNFTRTVQICGPDVLLDAGDGFDTYVWVSDDNGNGLFDATDTVLQDGTSDTLLVTQEGTYIVDKIVRDPCKGFKEVLVVERFGTNTENPIITFFNDTNTDADVTNDIEGQITTCDDDGSDFLSLFLCGTGDSQLLQTNLTDFDTISWELLDEGSCNDSFADGCGVTNPCYTYNQVATGGSYTVNNEGKYRLVITYEDGCFDRFYFDVFQNNVTVEETHRDIVCTTPGRINISNPQTGYGFQLVDLTNNVIAVPYSANNGPDFTITTSAVYRVDVVQLDNTGNPILGGCVFSTNPIPIVDRDFQVEVETTPQNCNDQATIQIDVFNVEPNYTYILRRTSDGVLIDDETAQPFNRHTFNVNAVDNVVGEYTIEVTTPDGCFYSEVVDVVRIPDPTLSAVVTNHIGCSDGTIELTAADGLPGYAYAIWSKDGPSSYTTINDIPGSEYQGSTFTFGSGENGTYEFVVVDANNCSFVSAPVTINDNGPMTLAPTNTPIVCSGTSTASLTIGTSGGVGPFMYSIDDGATYQATDTFVNLPAGNYDLRVTDSTGCDVQETYLITEPFTLSASAGVTQVVECNPGTGAEVRITNAQGGTAPYVYSFNGGANFGASNIDFLAPGTHDLVIRDAVDCEFPMTVVVPDPVIPPTFTHAIDYECDGEGTVTINSSNTTDFDYTYELNTVLNTPADSNVFTNVPVGTQTVTVNYVANTPPVASVLLLEDFGVGPTTSVAGISEIDPVYCYEQQSAATCDGNDRINDLQYAVTSTIDNPFGAWTSPNDQDDPVNGRYYVLNVGDPGYATIVYAKRDIEIIPNRDISVSLDVINLVRQGSNLIEPNILIELVDSFGTVIASETTGLIPENTGPDNWIAFSIPPLDPGGNSTIDIVIRTIATGTNGNDVAIDNIEASQMPEICASSVDIPVVIEAGRAFEANIINTTNVSCNGLSDGTITFEVENFDAAAGFNYSIDGAAPINSTNSPVTTLPILDAGNHVISIHKADDPSCTTSVNIDITEPDPLVVSANIDVALTCTNGATISANATGGTLNYIYQLEDDVGAVIGSFDFATNGNNAVFTNLPPRDYIVRVRDKDGGTNYCEDVIDTPLTVVPLNPIVFDVTPTNCYSGAANGSVFVNVTSGNGDYQFRIDSGSGPGPWITPSPANATTYTFDNLTNGTYDIEVMDGLGCPMTLPAPQTAVIDPELIVNATAPNITACGTSTDITITASGGDGNYVYAVVPNGNAVVDGDFNTTNPVAVTAAGDYDVHVRDNGGVAGYCPDMFTITIVQDAPILFTPTPTAVTCFGGSDGAISIVVDSGGQGPFMYSVDNGANYGVGADFSNLIAGTYQVIVRDANLCETLPANVVVSQPLQLASEAVQSQDYECGQLGQITVGIMPITSIATSGGSGDYQYSINSGPWTASTTGGHTFTDLTDDTYSIRVRDANAVTCEISLPDVVIAPLPVEPVFTSGITYNCDGTGEVTITPFDTNYTYILDGTLPGQTGAGANLFSTVSIGNHTVTVDYGSNCTVDLPVIVADGNAFEASITAFENLDCNGDNTGTITITAANFSTGFEYSLNGAAFVGPFTSPEQLTSLNAQVHNIIVRDVNTTFASGCPINLSQELTEPDPLVASASVTTPITCSNSGATITASAIGGTPTYEYQLETNTGTIVRIYQTTISFAGVPANAPTETYIVRVRDRAGIAPFCEDIIDTPISITMPTPPTSTAVAEVCYSGLNDGFITVTAAAGNPDYQFRIDSGSGPGPWITPSPASATHTFNGLSDGTYDIDVRDSYGCLAPTQTVTIFPALIASEEVTHVSSCADGSIVINASGGNGTLVYAVVPANTSPAGQFVATNTFAIDNATATANPLGFDIYVRDKNGASPICEYLSEDIVINPTVALSASATPTDPDCHDGLGSISTTVTGGAAPYTYALVDMSPADGIDYGVTFSGIPATTLDFNGIGVGDYQVTITDANSCSYSIPGTITINNVDEITIDIYSDLPPDCTTARSTTIDVLTAPTNTQIRYSADGGTTWQASNIFSGPSYTSGTIISPSIEVTRPSGALCIQDFPNYLVPYPLDDLDITLTATIVGCELQVTVEGDEGTPGYRYTYTDDPDNFSSSTPVWTAVLPDNTPHTFMNVDPTTPPAPGLPLLVPGREYVFYVEDSAGCIRQSNVNVNDIITLPVEISPEITPTCNGGTTGEITFTLTPVTPSTDMRWEIFALGNATPIEVSGGGASAVNVTYSSTITTTGLGAGYYYIEVTQVDSGTDQCTSASENAYVDELDVISGNPNVIRNISCNLPGLIEITGLTGGGGAPYTFDVTGPGGFTPLTGLNTNPVQIPVNSPAGAYTVTINDQYGCSLVLPSVPLTLSPNPTISVSQDNCSMPITVNVNAFSAAGNLRYAMVTAGNPAPTTYENNGGIFSNVTPGSYDFYVIDGNGCTNMEAAFVVNPVLDASATLTKLLDCSGTPNDAQITIAVVDGSGSYDYSITNTAGAPPVNKQPVPSNNFVYDAPLAGDYTITIYDNNTPNSVPCNREFVVSVAAELRPILSIDPLLVSNETCEDADNGLFTVTADNNGAGPFTFQITASSDAAVVVPINPTTFDGFNATFTNLTGSTAGTTYTVTATSDINDCAATIDQVITEPDPVVLPAANVEVVEFACALGNNQDNASITVNLTESGPPVSNVTGGSGNYIRYRFVNNTTSAVLQDGPNATYIETNSAGGDYDVYVYDDNGCFNQTPTTVTILPFDELLTVSTSYTVSCNPIADGEITLTTTSTLNDTTVFEYSIDSGTTWQTEVSHTGTQNVFSGLTVGIHNFLVRHAVTGCILPVSETIVDPNTFEIDVIDTTDVTCVGGADGTVTFDVTDPIGGYAGNYSWEIFNTQGTPANPADDGARIDFGTSASYSSTILSVGEYRISVSQDIAPGCANEIFFSIAEPTAPLFGDRRITEITCVPTDNGIVELFDATGGWGDYRYLVFATTTVPLPDTNDRSIYNSNPRFENLSAGTYQVWLIDANGCPLQLADAVLNDPNPIIAALVLDTQNCDGLSGQLQVTGVGGGQAIPANYSYQLQLFNTGTSIFEDLRPIQSSTIFSGLGAGEYQVIVSDQWGCTGTTGNTIDILEPIVPSTTIVKAIDCQTGNTDGAITVTQTGGSGNFDYSVTYPISGTVVNQATGVFTNLDEVGDYVFTITDQAVPGCSETITETLVDAVHPLIRVDAFTDDTCNDANSNGTISVSVPNNGISPYDFRIISGDGSSPGSPILPTSNTATTATFTGLTGAVGAGITYTIEVRGNNNCEDTITQVITQPEPITGFSVTPTPFECTTGNNTNFATITVDAGLTGGSNNFVNYIFTNTDTSTIVQQGANTSYTETNLLGGNYSIEVFDDNGCSATATATIIPFVGISDPVVTTTQEAACNPLNNAEIQVNVTVTPASATPNLEYTVTGTDIVYNQTNSTGLFTGLDTGNYTVTITNLTTGCVIETTHAIADPDVIEAVIVKFADNPCLDNAGGFDLTAVSNYTGTFDYQVYFSDGTPVPGATNTGTSDTASLPLEIRGLAGEGYYIEITEADPGSSRCSTNSNAITIIEPTDPITFTPSEEASPSCSNDQGVILVDPSGGNGPYDIELVYTATAQLLFTENGVEAAQFTGLAGGDYTVTVTDAESCVEVRNINLVRPEDFIPTISLTQLVCFNGSTGEAFTTVPSGRNVDATATYEYQLNTYDATGANLVNTSVAQSTITFPGLSAGFYSITISDNFGCSFTSPIEEIINPTEVSAQLIRTSPVTCLTGMQMELTASGGLSGDYEYRSVGDAIWIPMGPGIDTVTIPPTGDLPANTYRYEVRDAINGCDPVLSNEIEDDPIIPLAFSSITQNAAVACNGDATGRITAQAEFGMGNYQYELYYNAVGGQPFTSATLQVPSQPSGEFSDLVVGFYFVRVTSGVDCVLESNEIPITEPTPLTVLDVNNFTNPSCNSLEDGTITVELDGGAGGYQYAISPNLNQFDTENTFENLASGNYTVIAQDQNGCLEILEYTLVDPEPLVATGVATPEVCAGDEDGTIQLFIEGGTPPYSTRLSNEADFVQGRENFTGLSAGAYIIFVRDATGICVTDVGITVEPGANLNAEVLPVYECTGDTPDNYVNITLEDQTVIGEVLYALDSTDPTVMQLNPDFRNTAPGSHFIAIAHTESGCVRTIPFEIQDFEPLTLAVEQSGINTITATADGGVEDYTYYFDGVNNGNDNTYIINRTDTYVVRVVDDSGCEVTANLFMEFIDIEIPNFFTPDGDGLNDVWMPLNQEGFPEILTIIFDRYGREVYQMTLNTPGWDGLYNQSELPTGDYWYVIKLRGANDDREFVGHFTLYR